MSLECNYYKLQFKNWLDCGVLTYVNMHLYICNKTYSKKTIQEWLLSLERKDSELFPVSIGVCPAFLSRRASMNCCEGLEAMLLGGVVKKLAIVDIYISF